MASLSSFPATNILGIASSSGNPTYVSPTSSQAITGGSLTLSTNFRTACFFLNVAQAPANSSQLLDVWVQHSPDGGTTFDDFVAFTRVAGKVATATQIALWVRDVAPSSSGIVRTPSTRALASGTVLQGPVGASWRAEAVCASSASSSQPWKLNLSAQVAQ
jgi:hypothetical protein